MDGAIAGYHPILLFEPMKSLKPTIFVDWKWLEYVKVRKNSAEDPQDPYVS